MKYIKRTLDVSTWHTLFIKKMDLEFELTKALVKRLFDMKNNDESVLSNKYIK